MIIDEIYSQISNRADRFDNILYTHPTIFIIEYSLAYMLIESGIEPDYILGASLGAFTAAAITGALPLDISPEYFWNIVRSPIFFQKTITRLEKATSLIILI